MNVLFLMCDSIGSFHFRDALKNSKVKKAIMDDMFGSDSTYFPNCISQGAFTAPSVWSMLTGQYPYNHKIHNFNVRLKKGDGVSNPKSLLDMPNYNICTFSCTEDYVKVFDFPGRNPGHNNEIENAIEQLGKNKDYPFFIFVILRESHSDWEQKTEDILKYFDPLDTDMLKSFAIKGIELLCKKHLNSIHSVLEDNGLYDNTIVILTSDHGDDLGVHSPHWSHGTSLYDTVLRVPLLFRYPDNEYKGLSDKLVRSIDIAPTITPPELQKELGIEMDGIHLFSNKPRYPVYSESREYVDACRTAILRTNKRLPSFNMFNLVSYTTERLKYIIDINMNKMELYDLEKDPLEHNNLLGVI